MFFMQRAYEPASLAYFFGCVSQRAGVAVDVNAGDEAWFMEQAALKGVDIKYVIDTHIHADHVSGGPELARQSGAQYCLHQAAQCQHPHRALQGGEQLVAGNTLIDILHTPGHTDDSISLVVTDKSRCPDPWFVLTGHTLFVGSVGRPDLHGREQEMAADLYASIQKFKALPGELEIFPGAQAGSVCGAGISGKPASTLAFEFKHNKTLSLAKEEFIRHVTAAILPRPAEADKIVAANMGV